MSGKSGGNGGAEPGPGAKSAQAKKIVWKTLRHNGIVFPPEHEPKGFKVRIRGKEFRPNPLQEEMLYQWAKKKDTPYVLDTVFQKNFVDDFAKTLDKELRGIGYADIDFTEAYALADREKDARELLTKEERKEIAKKRKEIREELKAKYGTAMIDGKPVDMGNYMVEPPGIFMGREKHPLRGRWKRRIRPEDVTLNLDKAAPVPPAGDGHSWGDVVHNDTATWLATWTTEIDTGRVDKKTGKEGTVKITKYIWLAETAEIKQSMDEAKYDKAMRLSSEIGRIKEQIVSDMSLPLRRKAKPVKKAGNKPVKKAGNKPVKRPPPTRGEIATTCYLIYRTSMRVGDEKSEDETDTVGATTLRKEHVTVADDAINLDFRGKDYVRWQETIRMDSPEDRQLGENLRLLMADKRPKDEIFAGITSSRVNEYYSSIVKGLTAKVFRTYLASKVVAEYLRGHDGIAGESAQTKLYHAKMANLEAAVMCNHKRTIPKTFEQSLQKKRDALKAAKAKPVDIKGERAKKDEKIARMKAQIDKAARAYREAGKRRRDAIARAESRKAPGKKQEAARRKRLAELRARDKKASASYRASRRKRLEALDRAKKMPTRAEREAARKADRVERMEMQVRLATKTKDYNIGTSLRNYIDPRLFKAWTDEVGAEWSKLYTSALQRKFLWVRDKKFDWKEVSSQY